MKHSKRKVTENTSRENQSWFISKREKEQPREQNLCDMPMFFQHLRAIICLTLGFKHFPLYYILNPIT